MYYYCLAKSVMVTSVFSHETKTPHGVLMQKHKGRLSGSLEVSSRGTMDRMFSTPLANKERGITHRISKNRADFWKEEANQPQDKRDNHTGLLPCTLLMHRVVKCACVQNTHTRMYTSIYAVSANLACKVRIF